MKKLLLLAISGMFLMSCGGGASVCKCEEWKDEFAAEYDEIQDDDDMTRSEYDEAIEELKEKWEDKRNECDKMEEDMDEEEYYKALEDC